MRVDPAGANVYLVDMIKCGGCGRDIYPEGMDAGSKYLCVRCDHLQAAGKEPTAHRKGFSFISIAAASLAVVALVGLAICFLFLSGTGRFAWFVLLLLLMSCVVACPSVVLLKKRSLTLLISSLYIPLGAWLFLLYLAPGVHWEYKRSTAWGGFCFLGIGLLSLYLFLSDLRSLPKF